MKYDWPPTTIASDAVDASRSGGITYRWHLVSIAITIANQTAFDEVVVGSNAKSTEGDK